MELLILVLLGFIVGVLVTELYITIKIVGILRIDTSNPEKDLYRFDIKDLSALSKKKKIVLKVDSDADLS